MEFITLTDIDIHSVSFDPDGVCIGYTVRDSHKGANKHVHADCKPVGHTEHNGVSYVICEDADGYRAVNVNISADNDAKPDCDCLAATDYNGDRILYRNDDSACDVHGSASSPATDESNAAPR